MEAVKKIYAHCFEIIEREKYNISTWEFLSYARTSTLFAIHYSDCSRIFEFTIYADGEIGVSVWFTENFKTRMNSDNPNSFMHRFDRIADAEIKEKLKTYTLKPS